MFTDSEIAKGFSCGRTKTTQIVKRAIAPSLEVVLLFKELFGVATNKDIDFDFL
jgi:hypothetical protein